MRAVLFVALVALLSASLALALPSCKLTAPDGRVTDISVLNGVYETGVVETTTEPPGYIYSVAVCQDKDEKCSNTNPINDAVTQRRPPSFTGSFCRTCGEWNERSIVQWINPDEPWMGVSVQYFDGTPFNSKPGNRTSLIEVFCDHQYSDLGAPDLQFVSEDKIAGVYKFRINSIAGCHISTGGGGLSGGWIFLIVLFSLIAVYLAGGVAYNMIAKKASGVEALPNHEFWRTFFGCFWDGVKLVFCCRAPSSDYYGGVGGAPAKTTYSTNHEAGVYQGGSGSL